MEKSPCGSALGRTELKNYTFMYLRHKSEGCLFITHIACIFVGKKTAGAHPDTTNLDNTDSVYVKQINTDSVYVIHRYLCFRHRQCVYLQHRHSVRTVHKLRVF